MALERDKQKQLQAAERLVKQGKVQEAVARLDRMAFKTSSDLLSLNRMADLLARQGHGAEAVKYYFKIAEEFGRTGFYPKAAAIHKKILRLDADNVDSLVLLGDLYLQQRLPGEARKYLLHAAGLCLQAQDFALARSVYEKLIEAEPGDPRHRARLAETRAAEGDTEQAGEELILLADTLFSQGKPGDAEKAYLRAVELLPGRPEPVLGICKSAREQGREEEALAMLEKNTTGEDAPAALVGELAVQYQLSGREDDALDLLKRPGAEEVPPESLIRLFRPPLDSGHAEQFWERMDPVFERWASGGAAHRVEAILGRLATLEEKGHIPALVRLHKQTAEAGDRRASVRAMEELVRAYQARSMAEEAAPLLEQLEKIAPESSVLSGSGKAAPEAKPAAPAPEPEEVAPKSAAQPTPDGDMPVEAEAPAVPLNKADEEFVAGRLTQAEILEKYGLLDQATEQVREVTEKFPGHVPAQERLIALLRIGGGVEAQREVLIALALAQRAAGETSGAAKAVAEAEKLAPLDAERRSLMVRLGILEDQAAGDAKQVDEPESVPEPPAVVEPMPTAEARPAAETKPVEKARPVEKAGPAPKVKPVPQAASADASEDGTVVIDFDGEDMAEEAPAVAPAAPPPRPKEPAAVEVPAPTPVAAKRVRAPGADMIEEIRLLIQGGMADEARRRVETLRTLGYASPDLDTLEAATREAPTAAPVPAESPAVDAPELVDAPADTADLEEIESLASVISDIDDSDDLSAITAALESEIFADDTEAPVPEAQSEQSLEDVFAAFKQHVQEEVGSEDFRTHYDLGIAYKEMGLMDEAIGEFQLAVKAPEVTRESAIMLALCHREQGDIAQAAKWYGQSIAAPGGDAESVSGLRYDLAEMLLDAGDSEGALKVFRDVLEVNPSFRDVADRVEKIESRSTST